MLKKGIIIGCCLFSIAVSAQNTPAAAKVVIYKWSQNGVVHYSMQPPRGKGNVTKLDERGLVIRDESDILATVSPMRPLRPGENNGDSSSSVSSAGNQTGEESDAGALPEGAIPKSERCANAQLEIQTIENATPNQPITVEDNDGNLLPMTDDEKNARLESARALVERLCSE